MYFEAMLDFKKYKIDVNEQTNHWIVSMEKEGEPRQTYKIDKKDYQSMDGGISLIFENSSYMMDVVGDGVNFTVFTRGSYREIPIYNDESLLHESLKKGSSMGASNRLTAGMPGKIVKVMVKPGQKLQPKDPILIMEAMKMENEIRASHEVTVKEVAVKSGDSVESGALLVSFE